MGRRPGSKNKPKDNRADAAQTHDAAGVDHVDLTDSMTDSMAAKTLRGDVRDRILAEFRGMPKPWTQMSEREQERVIHLAADIAHDVVRSAVQIAAADGSPYVEAAIGKIEIADGLKLHLTSAGTLDNITKLASNRGPAVLVLIDPLKYRGQRAPAQPDVVGELRMPREPGVSGEDLVNRAMQEAGDELPGEPEGPIIDVEAAEVHGDVLDIPPRLRRLPPPSSGVRHT